MDFASDDQRKAVMSKLHQSHGIQSTSLHSGHVTSMPAKTQNKMLTIMCDWQECKDQCPFCEGKIKISKTGERESFQVCQRCNSSKLGNQQWNCCIPRISESDLKESMKKLHYPHVSMQYLWDSLPIDAKNAIIRTGSTDKQYNQAFKHGNYILKLEWNQLNTVGQFLFERGLEKIAHGKIINYQMTDQRPKNMKLGFQSALNGKWYCWEMIN